MAKKKRPKLIVPSRHLYVGIDESNHGAFPEIYVAVVSGNFKDAIKYRKNKFSKTQSARKNFSLSDLANRRYSFIEIQKKDYVSLERDFLGATVVTLLQDLEIGPGNGLDILVDGSQDKVAKKGIKENLNKFYGVDTRNITVTFGAELDRRVLNVNLADMVASYLFSQEENKRSQNPNLKNLSFFYDAVKYL